jgi:hypothetical protein
MKQGPSWEAKSHSLKNSPPFIQPECSLLCSQEPAIGPYLQSTPFYTICLRSSLILSSHLRLGLPNGLSPSFKVTTKVWMYRRNSLTIPSNNGFSYVTFDLLEFTSSENVISNAEYIFFFFARNWSHRESILVPICRGTAAEEMWQLVTPRRRFIGVDKRKLCVLMTTITRPAVIHPAAGGWGGTNHIATYKQKNSKVGLFNSENLLLLL